MITENEKDLEIQRLKALLKELQTACEGVPALIEELTEQVTFNWQGNDDDGEWENRRYRIAQNLRLALRKQTNESEKST